MKDPRRYELLLARALAKTFGKQRRALVSLLGNPPDPNRVTAEFWASMSNDLRSLFTARLLEVTAAAAEEEERTLAKVGIGFDPALVNDDAIRWLNNYAPALSEGIANTTRRALSDTIAAFFQTGQDRGELERAIIATMGENFSPRRAEMIAITEVTRAAAEGQEQVRLELAKSGIEMHTIYNTRADERVCLVCGPLNGKDITGAGLTPPLHPRCRCFTSLSLRPGEKPEGTL